MKISEHQLQLLIQILSDSIKVDIKKDTAVIECVYR